jgi:hypothetical protein
VLDAESTIVTNTHDPHSIKVFDPSIKGETDRFAYRFVRALTVSQGETITSLIGESSSA